MIQHCVTGIPIVKAEITALWHLQSITGVMVSHALLFVERLSWSCLCSSDSISCLLMHPLQTQIRS